MFARIVTVVSAVVLLGCIVYFVYYARGIFQRHRGQHTGTAFELPGEDESIIFSDSAPQYYPAMYAAPIPEDPPDEYLERFDALLLATRAQFAAIREFADAGFSSTRELEA